MTRTVRIREVWAANLEEEIRKISYLIDDFDHVAMDTEFPGVVIRPVVEGVGPVDLQYQTMRCNVDLLKIIQLGISLSNEEGESPEDCITWQFNFYFDLSNDVYAQDSIDLLTTSGIDFAEHERNGIDVKIFGELLTTSGLVLNENITWISFQGGYDFGYLISLLTAIALPECERDFFELMELFFPRTYDLKYLMLSSDRLYGGLNKLAELLGIKRYGAKHQAGSDSLLTLDVFFRMREEEFDGKIDPSAVGILFNLGVAASKSQSPSYVPEKNRGHAFEPTGNGTVADAPSPEALTAP